MRCDFCDEPAVMHMTNIDADTGGKTEVHACLLHAGKSGLPAATVRKMGRQMESLQRGMVALQAFVATERRVPSDEEMNALGLVGTILPTDPNDPLFHTSRERIRAMARLMLEEPPGPPPP